MRSDKLFTRLALGAVAGFAGTVALQALRDADQKRMPEAVAPIQEDPGAFMFRKATERLPETARQYIPEKSEAIASKVLAMGYGVTFGLLFALARPKVRCVVREGILLGLGAWAAGFLGWLPKAKLMPPIREQAVKQVALPIAEHAAFGVATVTGYRLLTGRAHHEEAHAE